MLNMCISYFMLEIVTINDLLDDQADVVTPRIFIIEGGFPLSRFFFLRAKVRKFYSRCMEVHAYT